MHYLKTDFLKLYFKIDGMAVECSNMVHISGTHYIDYIKMCCTKFIKILWKIQSYVNVREHVN